MNASEKAKYALLGSLGAFDALREVGADRYLPGYQSVLAKINEAITALDQEAVPAEERQPHNDHPLRHWDRTCPACIADKVPTKAFVVYSHQQLRNCLKELLRLYDWRNELGRIERDFNHDKKQMTTWLNQYGREKKHAWFVARELLTGGRKTPEFSDDADPSPLAMRQNESPTKEK